MRRVSLLGRIPPFAAAFALSRNGWLAITLVFALILALEAALQWRAYRQSGISIFTPVRSDEVATARAGIRTYPPNAVIRGNKIEIRTNALGLRSPDISPLPAKNELRLAVIGASTVAGAYTPKNEQLFSQQLVALLRRRHSGPVSVVNAGIPGATVRGMGIMLDRVVSPLRPHLVFVYTGFNDIANICKANTKKTPPPIRLEYPQMPSRLLLPELVKKNTASLRMAYMVSGTGLRRSNKIVPQAVVAYRKEVEGLASIARRKNVELVFVSSLAAYRQNMPRKMQESLSEQALYYVKCLDLNGLYVVTDLLNRVQAETARKYGFDYVDLRQKVSGGRRNFVDSNHFTVTGERAVAAALSDYLSRKAR